MVFSYLSLHGGISINTSTTNILTTEVGQWHLSYVALCLRIVKKTLRNFHFCSKQDMSLAVFQTFSGTITLFIIHFSLNISSFLGNATLHMVLRFDMSLV